eukprot:TRINITY_DN7198_c0_g1_i1.p2 TRINITY_DN7198_c0_g1~~TRINITY_DN7198_c0_g1_i1.p2  ORF type:complete len:248 (+),score=-22.60 TRINITY_DN7198_c0_g1_i1:360-1103(+)
MDRLEETLQRRRGHAGIARREAAADVDDVHGHRRLDDRRANALHRVGIGIGRHRLAADMEADAERIGDLAGRHQQLLGFARTDAELRAEAELGIFRRHAEPHAERQVGRATGGDDDLVELFHAVEREGLHVMREIRLRDRLFGLDRVHEAAGRIRQRRLDQAHFGDRGGVVMRDAVVPEHTEQVRAGVRLHRIHRAARKLLDEESGCPCRGVRTNERDRVHRARLGDVDAPANSSKLWCGTGGREGR